MGLAMRANAIQHDIMGMKGEALRLRRVVRQIVRGKAGHRHQKVTERAMQVVVVGAAQFKAGRRAAQANALHPALRHQLLNDPEDRRKIRCQITAAQILPNILQ